jgi:hypothetical protein
VTGIGLALLAAIVLGVAEGASYLAVAFLSRSAQTRTLLYHPPSIPVAEYEAYLRRRDPHLGWPPPDDIGGERYDTSGSRRVPAFPVPGDECVTLYGDSFTYASDVTDAEAWSNVLSRLLGCRVANFGVGGYGTDQAYLRFERNAADKAPVTVLGIHPTDAVRNLTRDAYLAFGAFPASFKPRFAYAHGKLVFLPLPTVPKERLAEFARRPENFLHDDMLLPGSRDGPVRAEFPYFGAILRVAFRPGVGDWLAGRPTWMRFYTPGDPSTGLEVQQGIAERFAGACAERGKTCVVLLFPTPKSHAYFKDTGRSALEHLAQGLERRGIATLDLSSGFDRALGDRSFCDLVDGRTSCAGHFNAQGNDLVAKLVHQYLLERSSNRAPKSGTR